MSFAMNDPLMGLGQGKRSKVLQTVLKLGIRRCWQYQSANEMGY